MKLLTYILIICVVLTNFDSFYSHDIAQELSEQLIITFEITQSQLNLLYTVYAASNIFLGPMASQIIDLIGLGMMASLSTACVFFGNFFVYFAIQERNYNFVILGKVIVGLGGELAIASAFSIVERYFKGGMLSIVNGIVQCLMQGGVALSNYITYPLYKNTRMLSFPFMIGTGLCGFCCLATLVYSYIEVVIGMKKLGKLLSGTHGEDRADDGLLSAQETLTILGSTKNSISRRFPKHLRQSRGAVSDHGMYFRTVDKMFEENIKHISEVYQNRSLWQRIKDLNMMFMLSCFLTAISTAVYYQFIGISTVFLTLGYKQEIEAAKNLISLSVIVLIVEIPILGYLINNLGGKVFAVTLSGVMLMASFETFFFLDSDCGNLITIPLFFFTQFFSLISVSAIPLESLSLPSRSVSFGLGLGIMFENLGGSISPMIVGRILKTYARSEFDIINLIGFISGLIIVLLGIWLYFIDRRYGGFLNMAEINPLVEEIRKEVFEDGVTQEEIRALSVKSLY